MQIAASLPPLSVAEDVPAERPRQGERHLQGPGAAAGKPAKVEKIVEGKLKKYYAEFCLLEQPFIKDPKLTVGQLIKEKIANIKENIVVRRFARFKVGEEVAAPAAAE